MTSIHSLLTWSCLNLGYSCTWSGYYPFRGIANLLFFHVLSFLDRGCFISSKFSVIRIYLSRLKLFPSASPDLTSIFHFTALIIELHWSECGIRCTHQHDWFWAFPWDFWHRFWLCCQDFLWFRGLIGTVCWGQFLLRTLLAHICSPL